MAITICAKFSFFINNITKKKIGQFSIEFGEH